MCEISTVVVLMLTKKVKGEDIVKNGQEQCIHVLHIMITL